MKRLSILYMIFLVLSCQTKEKDDPNKELDNNKIVINDNTRLVEIKFKNKFDYDSDDLLQVYYDVHSYKNRSFLLENDTSKLKIMFTHLDSSKLYTVFGSEFKKDFKSENYENKIKLEEYFLINLNGKLFKEYDNALANIHHILKLNGYDHEVFNVDYSFFFITLNYVSKCDVKYENWMHTIHGMCQGNPETLWYNRDVIEYILEFCPSTSLPQYTWFEPPPPPEDK